MAIDLELIPDLMCGRAYRDDNAEARVGDMREGEVTPFAGCGKPLTYLSAYRFRQCARWMHGACLDRHFGESLAATTPPGPAGCEPCHLCGQPVAVVCDDCLAASRFTAVASAEQEA